MNGTEHGSQPARRFVPRRLRGLGRAGARIGAPCCWLVAVWAALVLGGPVSRAGAASLQPPPGYLQKVTGTSRSGFRCPQLVRPFTGPLVFPSKYAGSDRARDQVNEAAQKAYQEGTREIRAFERQVARLADRYVTTGGDGRVLACLLAQLDSWARQDALLSGRVNHIGQAVRKWALATAASAWLKVKYARGGAPLQGAERVLSARRIEAWFGRLAGEVRKAYSGRDLKHSNNHDYWAAWSVAVTAVVLDREDLFTWALKRWHTCLRDQVTGAGYLPNELRRKRRALSYHNFALKPLVLLTVFARANGHPLEGAEWRNLQHLVERVLEGLADPGVFSKKTGVDQRVTNLNKPYALAWMEPWATLVADPRIAAYLSRYPSMGSFAMGGNLTRIYRPFRVQAVGAD